MKKYKLIKELPFQDSPKLNFILDDKFKVGYSKNVYRIEGISFIPENYPEFWEEVVEKEYEILSFYAKNISGKGDDFVDPDYIWYETSKGNDKWSRKGHMTTPFSTQEIINHNRYGIHSVRRLSDGEVFTVGDLCNPIGEYSYNKHKITTIEFCKTGSLRIGSSNYYIGINSIEHSKKVLFRTEDGVDIFEGDEVTSVNLDTLKTHATTPVNTGESLKYGNYKHFSTKEAAEDYIIFNIPRLSINDVKNSLVYSIELDILKNLVKSRL